MSGYQQIAEGVYVKLAEKDDYSHCKGKRVYKNEAEAQSVSDYRSGIIGEDLMPYRCRWCSCWHIGHNMFQSRDNVLLDCPNNCGQKIYKSKMNAHLDKDCIIIS